MQVYYKPEEFNFQINIDFDLDCDNHFKSIESQ